MTPVVRGKVTQPVVKACHCRENTRSHRIQSIRSPQGLSRAVPLKHVTSRETSFTAGRRTGHAMRAAATPQQQTQANTNLGTRNQNNKPPPSLPPQSPTMAPRTRLQAAPDRRVRYNGGSEAAHRQTATPTLTQPAAADRVTKERAPSRITRRGAAEAGSGISLAASIALHRRARATPIQRAPRPNRESRNQAAAPSPSTADKKSKADMKVCVLCIHEKRVTSFQPPKDMTVCQHFADICRSCVERTVRSRLGGAQLNDGDLNCVYTGCPTVIPYSKVKEMISPGLFES